MRPRPLPGQAGKLIEAAGAWWGAGGDETDEALAAFGLSRDPEEDDELALWPETAVAFALLDGMRSQWRLSPTGRWTGMDYAAMPFVCAMLEINPVDQPDIWRDLRVMEAEIIRLSAADR